MQVWDLDKEESNITLCEECYESKAYYTVDFGEYTNLVCRGCIYKLWKIFNEIFDNRS